MTRAPKTSEPKRTKGNMAKADMSKTTKQKPLPPERPLPAPQLDNRAEILPATHIDDDPESFRLT